MRFLHGDASTSTELVAGREEAFAGVSLAGELLMLAPKLIPEGMKSLVVGPMNDMAEPIEGSQRGSRSHEALRKVHVLVEHGVDHFLHGQELSLIGRIPQPKADFLAIIPVQSQQILLRRPELGQDPDLPSSLPHYRLDEGGDFPQRLQGFRLSRPKLLMLVLSDDGVVLEHCRSGL